MNNTRIYNNTNPLNINGISDDKTDCSRQSASVVAQALPICLLDVYAKELKSETVLTKMSKFTI